MKKKIVTLCLVIALVATMVAGGTLAYFTDSDEATNVFAIGNVDIELTEKVGTTGNAEVVEKADGTGAEYTGVTPGDKLQKEVKIANTGSNAAYVQVAVTLKNSTGDWANLLNKAIDEKYGDAAAQAWYDKVFVGFGLNHSKDLDGDGTSDAGMRLTITGEDMPEYVLHVDSTKTLTDYSLFYNGNWFGAEMDTGAFDKYHTTGMGEYEIKYVYYLYLEPGQESVLFDGLNVPYEFDEEQMKMFEGLIIDIDAKAIQASGFEGSAQAAFTALNGGEVNHVGTADELVENLENGKDVILSEDVKIEPANMSNAYGTTGINVKNGQTIDGNGNTLDVKGAGGTWDSGICVGNGTVKNITVTGSFRGIFIKNNTEKVVLENVITDGTTYTISCDQGGNGGLEAINCTFNGWTSYAATIGDVKFVNCTFSEGSGYAFCRPYAPTEFVGCEFEAGFRMDPRAAVTFENCTIDGQPLTDANLATLVTSRIENATVK